MNTYVPLLYFSSLESLLCLRGFYGVLLNTLFSYFLKIRTTHIKRIPIRISSSIVHLASLDVRFLLLQVFVDYLQYCDMHSASKSQVSPSFLLPEQTMLSVQNPSLQHGVEVCYVQSLLDLHAYLHRRKCEQTPSTQHLDMHSKLKSHMSKCNLPP